MAITYYLDWHGEQFPLPHALIKIARFIAKRTGQDFRDIANDFLNECILADLENAKHGGLVDRIKTRADADFRYCQAEGIPDVEAFAAARTNASLERAYQELRRDWRGY
jgi:hypothetical protein